MIRCSSFVGFGRELARCSYNRLSYSENAFLKVLERVLVFGRKGLGLKGATRVLAFTHVSSWKRLEHQFS